MDSNTYSASVAQNIAAAIKRAGRSVLSVAESTGIPYATLQRRLRSDGLSPFTVREVKTIADDLGTTALALQTVYVSTEQIPA